MTPTRRTTLSEKPPAPSRALDLWFGPALVVAVLWDAYHGVGIRDPWAFTAFDTVGAVGLLLCCLEASRHPDPEAWKTPIDRLIIAALICSVLAMFAPGATNTEAFWCHQLLSTGAVFYATRYHLGLGGRGRGLWESMPLLATVLGAHALWSATSGLVGFENTSRAIDAAWGGEHTLVKALAFSTLVTLAMALEPDAPKRYRVATLFGVAGTALYGAAGGFGLETKALARLDEPMYFCNLVLTVLVLLAAARSAWHQASASGRGERRLRWRTLATALLLVTLASLFGQIRSGEAVRMLSAIAAALAIAARPEPPAARVESVESTGADAGEALERAA